MQELKKRAGGGGGKNSFVVLFKNCIFFLFIFLKAKKYPAKSESCKKHARLQACHPAL